MSGIVKLANELRNSRYSSSEFEKAHNAFTESVKSLMSEEDFSEWEDAIFMCDTNELINIALRMLGKRLDTTFDARLANHLLLAKAALERFGATGVTFNGMTASYETDDLLAVFTGIRPLFSSFWRLDND